jgi:hypothetical protein
MLEEDQNLKILKDNQLMFLQALKNGELLLTELTSLNTLLAKLKYIISHTDLKKARL